MLIPSRRGTVGERASIALLGLRLLMNAPRLGLIVVAAGSSRRMRGADKLWVDLEGLPLLAYTLRALSSALPQAYAVAVVSAERRDRLASSGGQPPWSFVANWVAGGAHRQDSVYAGLCALPPCDLVVIHDGARPFVTADILARGVEEAARRGAATAGVPVTDTIKVVDPLTGQVTSTPDRALLWAVQTPQVFAYAVIMAAYAAAGADRVKATDDAGLVERMGHPVYVFEGSPANFKVSTPADLAVARALIGGRSQNQETPHGC